MVVTNGESPPPFPAQQSVHAYIHTHTHFLSLSYTHLLTHPDHQYARLTDALRPRVIEDAPFDSRSRPAVL